MFLNVGSNTHKIVLSSFNRVSSKLKKISNAFFDISNAFSVRGVVNPIKITSLDSVVGGLLTDLGVEMLGDSIFSPFFSLQNKASHTDISSTRSNLKWEVSRIT